MNMRMISRGVVAMVAVVVALAGCAGGGGSRAVNQENAVVHRVSEADLAATHGTAPIVGSSATLWVNGLGCPQCATNVDFQLKRIKGVDEVKTDLATGKVAVTFTGKQRPTPQRLSEAMLDAGVTLVKVEVAG